jgi:hypothetical protein
MHGGKGSNGGSFDNIFSHFFEFGVSKFQQEWESKV